MIDGPARLVVEALRLDRWSHEEVESRAARALELGVGGFVLFGGEVRQVETLTRRLRDGAERPLWIGADLERGAGQQIRGLTELPPPAALAVQADPEEAAASAGRLTGTEALSVGINWVLAPVMDLDAEPDNPIVATRSFGSDPALVTRLGLRWITACQSTGAIACAKHFPGHGRTRDDSHIGLPSVGASADTLAADIAPFAEAAREVGTMMVAHVAFPALGAEVAATVSPAIVSGLLRQRLGFDGPISTDAMIMGGVGDDDASAAVEAVRAGCDLICYPKDSARTIAALESALADPEFAARVGDALDRSERALGATVSTDAPPGDRTPAGWAVEFARGSIVANVEGLPAWSPGEPTRVLPVSDDPDVGPPAGREGPLATILAAELEGQGWDIRDTPGAPQCIVVLAATPRGWKGHGGPSDEALNEARAHVAAADRGLVVLLGHARWLERLGVPGLCGWSTETVMERAAAHWIHAAVAGEAP